MFLKKLDLGLICVLILELPCEVQANQKTVSEADVHAYKQKSVDVHSILEEIGNTETKANIRIQRTSSIAQIIKRRRKGMLLSKTHIYLVKHYQTNDQGGFPTFQVDV